MKLHQTIYGKVYWCVYGPDCFPTMFCCRIKNYPDASPAIWGYSVYRRVPGFRTLGQDVEEWSKGKNPRFFETQREALDLLAKLTTPRIAA